jgi:hypothetical protein
MSKFKVNVKLSGYEVKLGLIEFSVEGEKEDAQKISHEIERQLGGMIHAPTMTPHALTSGNGKPVPPVLDAVQVEAGGKRKMKKGGSGGSKTPAEDMNLVHDSAKFGTPQMAWTTVQKAIWFLYVVGEQVGVKEMTAWSLAKNFNKYFKASKTIDNGNVSKGLEKERVKGSNSTVGGNVVDGTTRYFLTTAGITMAEKLAKGEVVTE